MKYALGNMLNGAGSINPDGLALDLQFAADKTLTARKGPTPVFSRGSTGTFVGSNGLIQSAAINAPRFDHDPVTLASRGLLIEEQRQNLSLRSEEFDHTYWTKNSVTITSTTEVAPNGTTTAEIVNIVTANAHNLRSAAISVTASTAYTFSFYVKRGTATDLRYSVFNDSGSSNIVAPTSYYSETSASTWTRVSLTFTTPVGCTSIFIYPLRDGTSTGTVFLWGAQLESGSFSTSYIPTTTASVVRSADVCGISGTNFSEMYNQPEGTILVNAFTPASGDRTIFAVDDNTANEMIRLRTEGTNPFFKVTDGGSELVAIDSGAVVANTAFKLAGAYKLNDFASSINGGAAVTDTTGTIPTVDRMRIGSGQGGNTMCGCVSSLRYYKKRLPDAKLVTLTT